MSKEPTAYRLVEVRLGRLNNKGNPVEESHIIAFFTAAEVKTAARFAQHYESVRPTTIKEYRLENLYTDDLPQLMKAYPKGIPLNPFFVEAAELPAPSFDENNESPA